MEVPVPGFYLSSIRLLILLLLLPGCSELVYDADRPLAEHLHSYALQTPASWDNFTTCHHYDCSGSSSIALQPAEWKQVAGIFSPPAKNASAERMQIAKSIGLLEQLVGTKNNTFADQACNNFDPPIQSYQLDCVAEALNSTIYLQLLEKQQLLKWHRVSFPTDRNFFNLNAPHVTAVITQKDTAQLFAVDSWFHANGEAAEVVPLDIWRKGYYPAPCP